MQYHRGQGVTTQGFSTLQIHNGKMRGKKNYGGEHEYF